MEEREMREFSWSLFFGVTAVSFLAFSQVLNFLESAHSSLFLKIGLGLLGLGLLAALNKWLGQKLSGSKTAVHSRQP